jgi:hypothetical protein
MVRSFIILQMSESKENVPFFLLVPTPAHRGHFLFVPTGNDVETGAKNMSLDCLGLVPVIHMF